jgi:hypothetical protein
MASADAVVCRANRPNVLYESDVDEADVLCKMKSGPMDVVDGLDDDDRTALPATADDTSAPVIELIPWTANTSPRALLSLNPRAVPDLRGRAARLAFGDPVSNLRFKQRGASSENGFCVHRNDELSIPCGGDRRGLQVRRAQEKGRHTGRPPDLAFF